MRGGRVAPALRLRGRAPGPEQAALDFAAGLRGGWADRDGNEAGDLWPPEPPEATEPKMRGRHERACDWRRERGD